MSDSEVLAVAIVGQWRVGVPWYSERSLVRYMHKHGLGMFPTMLQRSAFNRRVRYLLGALVELQQIIATALETPEDVYDEVRERIGILNKGGGYIFNTIHNIQADVPVENVYALLKAIEDS